MFGTDLTSSIIVLVVGAALFITGMNMMSGGLKKAAGRGLKNLLRRIRNSRLAGFGIGAASTAIIQSSAATSVMAIGFINAGAMTIFQGTCIILGAYLGTTVTGLLVSLSTFSFSKYLVLLAAIGTILIFFTNEKVKSIGEILAGLGILFFGLECMSGAFKNCPDMVNAVQTLFASVNFPLLLLLIGAVFTALVQSSSATSGIVIVMVAGGTITMTSGLFLVLGGTIGTVITTIIATIGGSTNAKRTGLMCLIIRIICALIATLIVSLLEIYPGQGLISNGLYAIFKSQSLSVAIFLTLYNLIFNLALLPFVGFFEKVSMKLIKEKENKNVSSAIKFIDMKLVNMPSVAMMQAKKEVINMMDLSKDNLIRGYERIVNQITTNDKLLIDTEDQIDYINNKLTDFLIALSHNVELTDEKKIGAYFHVINDIERIGDHAYNFYETSIKMVDDELKFSDTAKSELNEMYHIIVRMFELTEEIFESKDKSRLNELHDLEDQTDKLKLSLSQAHYERITKNECNVGLSPFYSTFVSELERIADHLTNIAYSIVNPTGDSE